MNPNHPFEFALTASEPFWAKRCDSWKEKRFQRHLDPAISIYRCRM